MAAAASKGRMGVRDERISGKCKEMVELAGIRVVGAIL